MFKGGPPDHCREQLLVHQTAAPLIGILIGPPGGGPSYFHKKKRREVFVKWKPRELIQ